MTLAKLHALTLCPGLLNNYEMRRISQSMTEGIRGHCNRGAPPPPGYGTIFAILPSYETLLYIHSPLLSSAPFANALAALRKVSICCL